MDRGAWQATVHGVAKSQRTHTHTLGACQMVLVVKTHCRRHNLETQKMQFQSLGWEDPLEKEMATHSSFLASESPCTEEPGGLQSMGSQRIRHNRVAAHT